MSRSRMVRGPWSVAALAATCVALGASCSSGSSSTTSLSTPTTGAVQSTTQPPAAPSSAPTGGVAAIPAAQLSPAGTIGKRPVVTVPSGQPPAQLETADLIVGTGAAAQSGQTVNVQYDGYSWLNKKEFDASWDRGQPFSFQLGAGQVIPGWDQGVAGMKVGGRRELVIPPALAYGSNPPTPAIAQNDTLIFVVDLVSIG